MRDNGGHAVALWNSMRMIYGVDAGDVYWAASDVGWVVGHSYIVYAPLLRGCTTVMYEGKPVGTPDPGAFWRVCAQHGVKGAVHRTHCHAGDQAAGPDPGKFLKQHDPVEAGSPVPGRRTLRSADGDLGGGVARQAGGGSLVLQTETGWAITGGFRQYGLFTPNPGSGGRPCPGYDLHALDDDGKSAAARPDRQSCACLPLPPGCARRPCGRTMRAITRPIWRTSRAGNVAAATPA